MDHPDFEFNDRELLHGLEREKDHEHAHAFEALLKFLRKVLGKG